MSGNLIKVTLSHKRCLCQQVASLLFLIFNPSLEKLDCSCTLRKKDRKTLTDAVNSCEVFKFTTNLVVVTLSCFFNSSKMCFEFACLRESCTIDTGKLLALCIASPVSTCTSSKLERLNYCNIHKVRTSTKVSKFALLVEADSLALVSVLLAKLNLVRLAHLFQHSNCLVNRQAELFKVNTFLDNLLHLSLDSCKVVSCESLFCIKIIVETIVNSRTDSKLCVWVKTLNSLCKNVGSCVPESLLAFLAVESHNLESAVLVNCCTQVAYVSVNFHAASRLVESHADSLDNFSRRHRIFDFTD